MSGRLAQVPDSVVRVCACSLWTVGLSPSRQAGEREISVFSDAELAYLAEGKLGRLATIDGAGMPHVVPLGWRYNPELDTIDIGGRDFARTRKFRNAQHNPNVALVVDDVLPPWRPRCVLIRGRAEALADATGQDGAPAGPMIRLHPTEVISWGMESAGE
jgi:pyridoxamine 5'-phosphate oxidase family protein